MFELLARDVRLQFVSPIELGKETVTQSTNFFIFFLFFFFIEIRYLSYACSFMGFSSFIISFAFSAVYFVFLILSKEAMTFFCFFYKYIGVCLYTHT